MVNPQTEDPFSEIELPEYEPPQHEPTESHREEDQTPLVYAPDRVVPLKKKAWSLCKRLLCLFIYLGILAGAVLAILLPLYMSVSSWCIPLLYKLLLNMMIGPETTPHRL